MKCYGMPRNAWNDIDDSNEDANAMKWYWPPNEDENVTDDTDDRTSNPNDMIRSHVGRSQR